MPKIGQEVGTPDRHSPKKHQSCAGEDQKKSKTVHEEDGKSDENGPKINEDHCQNRPQTFSFQTEEEQHLTILQKKKRVDRS